MYEHTQIYKMYIKILRHGKRKKGKNILNLLTVIKACFHIETYMYQQIVGFLYLHRLG